MDRSVFAWSQRINDRLLHVKLYPTRYLQRIRLNFEKSMAQQEFFKLDKEKMIEDEAMRKMESRFERYLTDTYGGHEPFI